MSLLAHDAATFTMGLCRLYALPLGSREEREAARGFCKALLDMHFGPKAPLRVDVGAAAEGHGVGRGVSRASLVQ